MPMDKNKKSTLIALLFLVSIIGLSLATYQFRHDPKFAQIATIFKDGFRPAKQVEADLVVVADIEEKVLRMNINIPCKNISQKRTLMRSLPRIRHQMLMSLDEPMMRQWVEHRNFTAIKKHALSLVNSYSSVKVKSLFVRNFYYN